MPGIGGSWLRQLGIAGGVLGVAVMGEMEEAEIAGREQQQEPEGFRHHGVEPARAEGSAMDRFVERREQEGKDDSVRQACCEPRNPRARHYRHTRDGKQAQMGRQM